MDIVTTMQSYIAGIARKYQIPAVRSVVFPLIISGGFVRDCHFLALQLDDGSTGLSYINVSAQQCYEYQQTRKNSRQSLSAVLAADSFGSKDAVANMIGMAAINAVSRFAMAQERLDFSETSDPFAGLSIGKNDTLGMVGFFRPLVAEVERKGARLIVLEKNVDLLQPHKHYDITSEPERLRECNKIFITATTVLNQTIDDILTYCDHTEHVAAAGPTLGFLPDPLFARGISAVGGRYVDDGETLIDCIRRGYPWGNSTRKTLFFNKTYTSPLIGGM